MHATVLVLGEDVEALMDPYSEHDPDAVEPQWDSWVIQGRGPGYLLARPDDVQGERSARREALRGAAAAMGRHQLRRGVLDLEGMRAHAQEAAESVWPTVARVLKAHGAPKTLRQMKQGVGAGDAWRAWRRQPGMDELLPVADLIGGLSEELPLARDEFVARARLNALPAYAFLSAATGWVRSLTYDEQWNPTPVPGYAERVNQMVEQAPADTLVTLVDYHC